MSNILNKAIIVLLFLVIVYVNSLAQVSEEQVDKNKISEYFQNEQYADAIEYLQNKNVAASNDINSINALGYAYFMSEKYIEAQQYYAKVLALDSLNFTANRYSALINNFYKDYSRQLFYYQRLLRIQPANAGLYKLTGDTYSLLKYPDSALLFYAKAYSLQPANVKITYPYADNLLDQELFATADSVTKAFLAKDSLNITIIKLSIRSFMAQKKMANAAAFTDRWLSSGEIDPKTSVSIASANYNIKNYDACYKVCDTLIQQGIETEALLYYASQAKYKLKEYTKSNELLKQCLSLAISKNTNIYYFSVADNYEALKEYKKLIHAYDTAFYLFKDPLALYNMGDCTTKL